MLLTGKNCHDKNANKWIIEEKEPVEEATQELIQCIATYMPPAEQELAEKALQLAQATCAGVRGLRPIPPLEHALAIANILAQMHIDAIGVSAGLIFEAVDADLLALEQVEDELGAAVSRVVDSMLRMNILERKKQSMTQGLAAQPERRKATIPKSGVFASTSAAVRRKPCVRCSSRCPKIRALCC